MQFHLLVGTQRNALYHVSVPSLAHERNRQVSRCTCATTREKFSFAKRLPEHPCHSKARLRASRRLLSPLISSELSKCNGRCSLQCVEARLKPRDPSHKHDLTVLQRDMPLCYILGQSSGGVDKLCKSVARSSPHAQCLTMVHVQIDGASFGSCRETDPGGAFLSSREPLEPISRRARGSPVAVSEYINCDSTARTRGTRTVSSLYYPKRPNDYMTPN